MELLLYTAALPQSNGQWDSCSTLLHCLGVVGSGIRGAVWCGVVCQRCCYQMAMAGMCCIWVMQNRRDVYLNVCYL